MSALAKLDALIADFDGHPGDLIEVRAKVAELIVALRGANDALTQPATYPADVGLARKILAGALDRIGGAK